MSHATIDWRDAAVVREEGLEWPAAPTASAPPARDTRTDRIAHQEGIWGGMATVAGSRIPVFMIADLEAEGVTVPEIRKRYPHLTTADIFAALAYAHEFRGIIDEERAEYWRAVVKYRR